MKQQDEQKFGNWSGKLTCNEREGVREGRGDMTERRKRCGCQSGKEKMRERCEAVIIRVVEE